MIDDFELSQRILCVLEEAGEENLPTIANSVLDAKHREEVIPLLRKALIHLIENGDVRVEGPQDVGGRLTELSLDQSNSVAKTIDTRLRFDVDLNHWTGSGSPWPEFVTTSAGNEKGRAIINRRGDRWWITNP